MSATTSNAMTGHLPHSTIILASAGTGKTYQLASRFVALIESGVDPARLLATTFTRQAAGQIFGRIVQLLLDATEAHNPVAARSLATLLRRVDRLRIATLDSFFAGLASGYAAELGLPPGWRIVDEDVDERLRTHAVELALEDGDRHDILTLLRLMMAKRFSSSAAASLLSRVGEAHSVFLNAPADAWNYITLPEDAIELSKQELATIVGSWAKVPLAANKSGQPNANWDKAHTKSLESIFLDDWQSFAGKGLAAAILAGEGAYYKIPIGPEVLSAYTPLLNHARHVLLSRHIDSTSAMHDLLGRFDRAYTTLKRRERAFRFDDVPRALAQIKGTLSLDDIAFRLDGQIDHVLLDEFQDTSTTQFQLLEPLLGEILSGGGGLGEDSRARSVFCVGDLKQSLYQWRDAEPGLFAGLPARWPQFDQRTLHVSYRSAQPVLDAVNSVFSTLTSNDALTEFPGVTLDWQNAFALHSCAPHLKDSPGFVRITVAPTPSGPADDDQSTLTLRHAMAHVARLAHENPRLSIAVLVRAKRTIPRLIYELKKLGVSASEEGGNPLTDAPAVAAALSALQLADHPGDKAAAFHVATSPLGETLHFTAWRSPAARSAIASRIREAVSTHGTATLLTQWLDTLTPSCDARDVRRFEQLINLARAFDARNDPRTENLVKMARSRRVDDPTDHNVRVMTIHASKGLEFAHVVLPDLDSHLSGKTDAILSYRPDPFEPIQAVTRHPNEALRALDPRLDGLYQHHRARKISESLGVLYVAMTRAEHALDCFIAPDKPPTKSGNTKTSPLTLAGILRTAFAPGAPALPGTLFAQGDEDWHHHLKPAPLPKSPAPIVIALKAGSSPARLGFHRPPSATGHAPAPRRKAAPRAADRGTLLHAFAEQIEWLDTTPLPDSESLIQLAQRLNLDPSLNLAQELARFRTMLEAPDLKHALSHSTLQSTAPGTTIHVRREVPFAYTIQTEGSRRVVTGRIDRLVLWLAKDGSPTRARVLDYKSDAVDKGLSLEALTEQYRPQINTYRLAAARLTGLSPDTVDGTLLFLAVGKAVNL